MVYHVWFIRYRHEREDDWNREVLQNPVSVVSANAQQVARFSPVRGWGWGAISLLTSLKHMAITSFPTKILSLH